MQVGVIPTNGTEENAQWNSVQYKIAEQEPEVPETSPDPTMPPVIDRNTEAQWIEKLQDRLYELGWIVDTTTVTRGTLDTATLQAVAEFQTKVNTMDMGVTLQVLNPEDPNASIDEATLKLLMDVEKPIKP